MKKSKLTKAIMSVMFCTLFGAAGAQNNLRTLIQGEKGTTATDTRLAPEQQVSFVPSQAKTIFGVDENSDLVLKRTETDHIGFVHYRYFQTWQGVPVENSMYIVHTQNGMMTGMSGSIVLDFDEQMSQRSSASLPDLKAVESALKYVGAQQYAWQDAGMEQGLKNQSGDANATYYPAATLAWYSAGDEINPRDLRLCYKVDVYALQPLSRAYYFVDAQTGKVLGKKDELFYSDATGTCNTAYSGTQTIHSDFTGSSYRLRDLTKGNGVVTLRATSGHGDYTSASANWSVTGADQYALDAHYGVSQTWSFYSSNFGRNSVDNAGKVLTSYVNETSTVNNAYWDGGIMHFGVRSGSGAGITAIDVTGHELTHGVTQYTSGLNYSYQSGAMNESMSDIFGKSVQFWSKPTDVNWLMSNDMTWNIRNMSNPNQFSQPDTYLGTYWTTSSSDNGGVHTNSGVGNFMFYLLVTGGSGTNDIGNAYSVTGLGLTKADAILYRSETAYLTPTSQYSNWRTACISAATDLYGASSNELTQVMNAWYAVGIGTAGGGGGCSIPSGLSASSITNSSATLSWATTGANTYNLQWKPSSSSTWTTVTGLTATSYNLTGLTTCTGYNYQVQGVCSTSTSAYSSTASFTTTGCSVTYCTSRGNNTTYEYISRVALGTINNTSGNNGGYADYTALSTNLAGGTSNTITLVPGFTGSSYTEAWKVYVDYNHNGVFTDAGENVVSSSGSSTRTVSFTVPATALNGATRMRVQMKYSSYATNSCTTFTYGEVEDYTVNVTGNAQFGAGNNTENSAIENAKGIAGVVLYPNPVHDHLSVEFNSSNSSPVKISISNLMGQQVMNIEERATEGLNTLKLNTGSLSKGVYIFEIENNGTITREKFILSE